MKLAILSNGPGNYSTKRLVEEAKKRGLTRIELDVWAFNDAMGFYKAEGFRTFRTFLECDV